MLAGCVWRFWYWLDGDDFGFVVLLWCGFGGVGLGCMWVDFVSSLLCSL